MVPVDLIFKEVSVHQYSLAGVSRYTSRDSGDQDSGSCFFLMKDRRMIKIG